MSAQFKHLEDTSPLKEEAVMKFFFKCLAIFLALTVILTLGVEQFVNTSIPLSATALFSAFASLLLTLLYGWIDAVYIKKRQPGLESD